MRATAFGYRLSAFRLMKPLLIITIAALPLMGDGRPAQESKATTVPQIQAQKLQQVEEAKAEESEISIHRAAWEGDTKAIEQHLAAGKDVNAKDDLYGDTPLLWAAGFGHKGVVEMLITKGADVNAKAEGGWTPLHYATGGNDKEIVELLIAKGADLNAKDVDGETPLNWAEEGKHKEIADLLREHGGKTGDEMK